MPSALSWPLPWRAVAVPLDHPGSGKNRCYLIHESGQFLGIKPSEGDTTICLVELWEAGVYKESYVPWEFLPVPEGHPFSGEGQYYIINRWREADGEKRVGR